MLLALIPLSLSAQRMTRRVFITAVDAAGAPVLDLTAADLRLTENGSPREVTRVALGKAPMRIVLLVDSSAAMAPMINNFRAALNTFIDTLPAEHEITSSAPAAKSGCAIWSSTLSRMQAGFTARSISPIHCRVEMSARRPF